MNAETVHTIAMQLPYHEQERLVKLLTKSANKEIKIKAKTRAELSNEAQIERLKSRLKYKINQ